ncbi:hypothetical protein V8G54_037884 (chloroplast) [Vigna mungo]|uniref:1,4-alpha-D-glucan glucanohydrolase n=1 Tax=Vigna mungo TaxID=3915 RepID=A0AAQ3REQ4_VIGMU
MKQYGVRSIADIVINHQCCTTKGYRVMYSQRFFNGDDQSATLILTFVKENNKGAKLGIDLVEGRRRKRFCKNVSKLKSGMNGKQFDYSLLDFLADEVAVYLNVFRSFVKDLMAEIRRENKSMERVYSDKCCWIFLYKEISDMYNRFDGIPLAWDEHAVAACSGGLGNPSTDNKTFPGFPNIDHTKEYVRKDILNWLRWLRYGVGFEDFQFDFVRGIGMTLTINILIWTVIKAYPRYNSLALHNHVLLHFVTCVLHYLQNNRPFPKDHVMEAKHDLCSVVIDEKLSMKIGEGSWCRGGE